MGSWTHTDLPVRRVQFRGINQRRFGMGVLLDFFAVRPIFTLWGLKVVWYMYLLNTLIQAYIAVFGIFQALAQRGISWEAWSPNFLPLILGIVVQLALVRLLLEVAAIILSTARHLREQPTAPAL
jgi:hypothetical protein